MELTYNGCVRLCERVWWPPARMCEGFLKVPTRLVSYLVINPL